MPSLTLPLSPGTNRMYRNFRGITVLSKEARDFKHLVAVEAAAKGVRNPLQGDVMVAITYHPKGRKKETDKPLRRLDCDAHIKPTLDALIGVAYLDDYQVVEVTCKLAEPTGKGALIVEWEVA